MLLFFLPLRYSPCSQTSVGASVPEWMHPALMELETAVRDDKVAHKNTAILLEAQVAVRRLCGGRVTFCKSGKVCVGCLCACVFLRGISAMYDKTRGFVSLFWGLICCTSGNV